MKYTNPIKRIIALLFMLASLLACSSMEKKPSSLTSGKALKTTHNFPTIKITDFSQYLSCMDDMMIEYGVRKSKLILGEFKGNADAGFEDFLFSAIQNITKKSHALRVENYKNNANDAAQHAKKIDSHEDISAYQLQGEVYLFDSKSIAQQKYVASSMVVNIDKNSTNAANYSILGVELRAAAAGNSQSADSAVISRTSTIFLTNTKERTVTATINQGGIKFQFIMDVSNGYSQALSNLAALGLIELIGRLHKLPYWDCLGIDPEHQNAKILPSDWYSDLVQDKHFKKQGNIKNIAPLEFTSDTIFLPKNTATPSLHAKNEKVVIVASNKSTSFRPGESLNLGIKTESDGYLYCFHKDFANNLMRIFPNRFISNSAVSQGQELNLPGAMPFLISTNIDGKTENIRCFLTSKDILADLPDSIKVLDFVKLKVSSMSEIEQRILQANGNDIFTGNFDIIVKQP